MSVEYLTIFHDQEMLMFLKRIQGISQGSDDGVSKLQVMVEGIPKNKIFEGSLLSYRYQYIRHLKCVDMLFWIDNCY